MAVTVSLLLNLYHNTNIIKISSVQKPEIKYQYTHAVIKMVSVIKHQLLNETRENQGVLYYVCTPSSRLLSILFGKVRVIRCSGYSLVRDRQNFEECCLCIHEARIGLGYG